MRHDVRLDGEAFALRPVEITDAAFIARLRSSHDRSRFLHPVSDNVDAQVSYLADYAERPGDYYFIITRRATGATEGTVGLYDVDQSVGAAEWGRWILVDGSMAALESAVLVYRVAFDVLGLDFVYCRTVAENTAVVSFHESFGLKRHAKLPAHFRLGERIHDAIEHRLVRERWEAIRPAVEAKAARVAVMLGRRS